MKAQFSTVSTQVPLEVAFVVEEVVGGVWVGPESEGTMAVKYI